MYKFHHMSLKIKFELFYENKFIQKYITLHILKKKHRIKAMPNEQIYKYDVIANSL